MFQELLDLVKGHAQESVINNPDVPNEHNDAVVAEATNSITNGIQGAIAGGGLHDLMSLVGSGSNISSISSNPVIGSIISNLTGSLVSKFGLQDSQANGVANSLIPNVVSSLISGGNAAGGFNIQGLLGSLTGGGNQQQGSGGGIMDLVQGFLK